MEHQLGIIGFGGMGGWHGHNAQRVPGLKVRGVYDVRESQLKLAESMGMIGYPTMEALLEDEAIDIVTVATPNKFHKEIAIKALRAGKNVVCEKPATMNTAEFDEIVKVAEEEGKLFTCHQNRRWDKDYQMVRKTIESGDLGTVYQYESRIHGKNGKLIEWRDNKEMGGGILLDWCPHMLDQILLIQKEPVVQVYAQLHKVVSRNVEDYFKLILRFESGCSALIEVGTLCLCSGPRWVVHGTNGSMTIQNLAATEGQIVKDKVHLAAWNSKIIETDQGPTRTMAPRPVETMEFKELPNVDGLTDWTHFYGNIMDAIDGTDELRVRPAEVRRAMLIIDAARESDRLGQCMNVRI